jgi:hypothetical protein
MVVLARIIQSNKINRMCKYAQKEICCKELAYTVTKAAIPEYIGWAWRLET